jgi:hypothetical protein
MIWTQEEEDLLKEFLLQGYTNKQVGLELGRSEGSIEVKRARLGLQKRIYKTYTDEELINFLKNDPDPRMANYKHRTDGVPCAHTFINRFGSWNTAVSLAGKTTRSSGGIQKWTDEELLEILASSGVYTMEDFDRIKDKNIPCAHTFINRFNTWSNALELANVPPNKKGFLIKDRETILYLVYFLEDDFFKAGITQRSIKERLRGYPTYEILIDISLSLTEALILEKKWLNSTSEYKYVPTTFPKYRGGETECFRI